MPGYETAKIAIVGCFASAAVRVLRSVGSGWQTGWAADASQTPANDQPLMITRSRIFIMAAVLCHLLLWSGIVTSQTPPAKAANQAAENNSTPTQKTSSGALLPKAAGPREQEVTIRAVQQEKDGPIYHLRGQAEIDYRTYILRADRITYN